MKVRLLLIAVTAVVMGLGLTGCLFDTNSAYHRHEEVIPQQYPADLSAPESLVVQLEVAYRRREIEPYAALLSAEFKFIFLEADAQGLPKDFYTHDEDSLATANLFQGIDLGGTGGNVTGIRIDLTTLPPEATTLEEFPGDELQLVRVISTFLDVDLDNGWTLRVSGDQQLFYFRQGKADLGENPARWYLVQWQDLGGLGALVGVQATAVESTTWGGIKKLD